jgi:hypothetical protein
MKIIGQMFDEVFLLDVGDRHGQVLDLKKGLLFPPEKMSMLTSQVGPWYDYTGPQERLAELLAQVKPAPPVPRPVVRRRTPEEYAQLMKELDAEAEAGKAKK